MNFRMLLLKTLLLPYLCRLLSNLFHSIITDGKKEFLKNCFGFKVRNFIQISECIILVSCGNYII